MTRIERAVQRRTLRNVARPCRSQWKGSNVTPPLSCQRPRGHVGFHEATIPGHTEMVPRYQDGGRYGDLDTGPVVVGFDERTVEASTVAWPPRLIAAAWWLQDRGGWR